MDKNTGIVVIGGGQAGIQLVDSLRGGDAEVPITVIADEIHPPYQRPPLSKSLWSDDIATAAIPLRSAEFFRDRNIRLLSGVRASRIDRDTQCVHLDNGTSVPYSALVLATGARPRTIPLPGAELPGVHQLRTLDDGLALQRALRGAKSLVVIGGGFIGLEIATSATQYGMQATVLELQSRTLERAVTAKTSQWLTDFHVAAGTDIRLSTTTREIVSGENGHAHAVITGNGERIKTDLVVLGVGAVANTDLAAEAGLVVDNGVVVDATLQTSDSTIWAIGDCVRFPSHYTGATARLESVQNAIDQARVAAKNIIAALGQGAPEHYTAVPWFWSNQGPLRLQIAGIGNTANADVVVRDYGDNKVSVFAYEGGKLTVVESVNAANDHTAARRIIASGGHLDPELAADPNFPLKAAVFARSS
jgi:3-phenylpropionate/trans-cinnamate dioxygenase ferredoxin reductase subunit